MPVRGIRGATIVTADEPDLILKATQELLESIQEANPGIKPEDIASVLFTVTEDLRSAYPAQAARAMGWVQVPLICTNEIPVIGSLPLCIRVLIHWNTETPSKGINHVYLHDAVTLRPDLKIDSKTDIQA
jgi:chorismate mutase